MVDRIAVLVGPDTTFTYVNSMTAHKKEELQMSRLIPQDIETFLHELGTLPGGAPGPFEQYAKAAAALLWEKYCILEDPSIQILPNVARRIVPQLAGVNPPPSLPLDLPMRQEPVDVLHITSI